ncbi:MAG: phosphatase PAP2 family protein [Planctomycetes bacterium]|nr:phosphatase PAP2 family protein [Planctomycetota bacterium]
MRYGRLGLLALVLLIVAPGCGTGFVLSRQAQQTCATIAAEAERRAPAAEAPSAREPSLTQTFFFAPPAPAASPAGAEADLLAPLVVGDASAAVPDTPAPAPAAADPFASIKGRAMCDVMLDDVKDLPRSVGRGFKHAYAKPENLIILAAAFGADRIVRYNLDGEIRDDLRHDRTSMAETGDFGSVVGNPALHFGIAGAWYLASVRGQDDAQYAKSRTMIQALLVNGISTVALKVPMGDESPNGEKWGWPSGHTSSSMCFASVMHAYYGWEAGVPLYLLAGYSAATRLEDREHDLSDLVFGAALGLVIGHSVAHGELPEVAGFQVLPFGGRDAGGLMLMKRW